MEPPIVNLRVLDGGAKSKRSRASGSVAVEGDEAIDRVMARYTSDHAYRIEVDRQSARVRNAEIAALVTSSTGALGQSVPLRSSSSRGSRAC